MNIAARISILASLGALLAGAGTAVDAAGRAMQPQDFATRAAPTPYPSRAEDWPGSGAIRVYDWMKGSRDRFWRERHSKQGSIVFAGDSLTGSWETLGSDFPGVEVANRGIGGDVSRGLLFRFEEDVLALHPKAIVILIGINDLTAKQPASDTLANVRSMLEIRQSRQPNVPVVLCTVPPSANPKATVDEQQRRLLNEGLRRIAAESKLVSLVDLHAALATADGAPDSRYFTSDLLHLSAAGHARWKQALLPALKDTGVLPP